VEVIGLLANHELRSALEAIVEGNNDDEAVQVRRRARQQQRRLVPEQVAELVVRYQDGGSIDGLARAFEINRTTVIRHLEVNGIPVYRTRAN